MNICKYSSVIDGMTWSYTRLESFEMCPYAWFLKYISGYSGSDMFYASYGSFIHKIYEEYYKGKIRKDELLHRFLSGFSTEVKGKRPSASIVEKYINSGISLFSDFKPFKETPIAIEDRVDFSIDGFKFIGYVDYVGKDITDDSLVIIDNKSRDLKPRGKRRKPTINDMEIDKMLRQLYLYSIGVKEKYGDFPKRLCINCFRNGTFIDEPFKEEALSDAIDWAMKTRDTISKTDDFYPVRDFFVCNYLCGVRDNCCYSELPL